MSHHLVASDGRAFTATPALWESALFLAEKYGWKPAGTEPPPLPEDVIHSKSVRGFRIWERMLDRWSASLVAVEVTSARFPAALRWLADLQCRWPLARSVALTSRELDEEARWALREAGAIHVARSPRELRWVASIAGRQLALAPARETTLREKIFGSLPWAADSTLETAAPRRDRR